MDLYDLCGYEYSINQLYRSFVGILPFVCCINSKQGVGHRIWKEMSWPKQRSSEDKHTDGTRDFHGPCLGTSPCPSLTCQPFDIHIPPRICHSEPTCTPQPLWRCGHERSSQPPGWCNMRRDMWGEIYTLYTHLWQTWKKCSCDRAEENRFISKLSPSTEKTSQRWSPWHLDLVQAFSNIWIRA